jgi:hypothetical protein
MFRKPSLLLASVVCLGLAAAALGQTGPIGPQNGPSAGPKTGPTGPTGPTNPATVNPQPAPAAQGLSDQALLDYLRSLDANVKVQKYQSWTHYDLTLSKGSLTIPVRLEVNSGYIWMRVSIGNTSIADPVLVPATVLADLLKVHERIGPTFFQFAKVNNGYRLQLMHRVDRTSVQRLQAAIQEFTGDIQNSSTAWNAFLQSVNGAGNNNQKQ